MQEPTVILKNYTFLGTEINDSTAEVSPVVKYFPPFYLYFGKQRCNAL